MTGEGCDLTERELYAAEVVGTHYAAKLRTVVICMAFVAAIAIGGMVLGWILVQREGVNRAADIAHETRARAAGIESSRLQLLIDTCETANDRNAKTLSALDGLAPKHPSPEVEQSLAAAKLIIAAIVPFTPKCKTAAKRRLASSVKAPSKRRAGS
jgi:hypothetical protein